MILQKNDNRKIFSDENINSVLCIRKKRRGGKKANVMATEGRGKKVS